jgi:aryl-alcohol dehydrogenase-like predicted oxidoreductase
VTLLTRKHACGVAWAARVARRSGSGRRTDTPENFDTNQAALATVRKIAAETGAQPGQVALSRLLHQAPNGIYAPDLRVHCETG